jgi:hypothetical protein
MKYLFDQPTLNDRQIVWLEFTCEYDFDIKHIKGKENKVVEALNMRVHEIHDTTIIMYQNDLKGIIFKAAKAYLRYMEIVTKLQQGKMQQKVEYHKLGNDEILLYMNKNDVTNYHELRSMILKREIAVVKRQYYWVGMKREIVEYISKCMVCQKVKVEHRHPVGLIHTLTIPECKWEVVSMDFITKLHITRKHHDSIMVVVEKLTKSSHFIPMKITHNETGVVDIYMREVACLHGIPKKLCLIETQSSP